MNLFNVSYFPLQLSRETFMQKQGFMVLRRVSTVINAIQGKKISITY